MPQIKIKHIVSFTSEDKIQCADNLLNNDNIKPWLSKSSGETPLAVTLQLEKACRINKIDIGNAGSAFIEVLVNRSDNNSDNFKAYLANSMFMSPIESRSWTNTSVVRMFTSEHLCKELAVEKWDRVKVICNQPFNKTNKYGIAFITLNTDEIDTKNDIKRNQQIGIHMKPESQLSGTDYLLSTRKQEVMYKGAAACRQASKQAESLISSPRASSAATLPVTPTSCKKPRLSHIAPSPVRNLATSSNLSSPRSSNGTSSPAPISPKPTPAPSSPKPNLVASPNHNGAYVGTGGGHSSTDIQNKQVKIHSPRLPNMTSDPFHHLLANVVFALSGYENPERSLIRDEAVGMGATYSQHWTTTCTHLICAFKRTPKYKQASGRGHICKSKWIHDCHRYKKLLDWHTVKSVREFPLRTITYVIVLYAPPCGAYFIFYVTRDVNRYKLDDARTPQAVATPTAVATPSATTPLLGKRHRNAILIESDQDSDKEDVSYNPNSTGNDKQVIDSGDDDSGDNTGSGHRQPNIISKRVLKRDNAVTAVVNGSASGDELCKDKHYDDLNLVLPDLPTIFSIGENRKRFFINKNCMNSSTTHSMRRIIMACDGLLEQYVTDEIDYIISEPPWNNDFDEVIKDNTSGQFPVFVKPEWLHQCLEHGEMIDSSEFQIVKSQ